MRALVTGASGFVGSTLVEELVASGFEVHALMRKTSSVANLGAHVRFERREGELGDLRTLKEAVKGMDYVFHLAGVVTGPNREFYFEHNAEGTRRLAEAVAEDCPGIRRFVYLSSLAAGGPAEVDRPRVETDSDAPVTAYGWSKLSGEHSLLKFKDSYPITIVRPPMVYGPRDKATFLFFDTVAKNIIPMFRGKSADGQKRYTAIHVRDLARGVRLASAPSVAEVPSGELFYLTHDEVFTFERMMDAIASQMGKRPWKLRLPQALLTPAAHLMDGIGKITRRSYPLNRDKLGEIFADQWTCSSAKARERLGFKPEFDLARGLENAVEWYRTQGWIR